MWHCINKKKEVDKPRKWSDTLQHLCQSAPILVNVPNGSFPWLTCTSIKKTQHSRVSSVSLLQCVWLFHYTDLQPFSVGSQHTCERVEWVRHTWHSILAIEPLHSSCAAKPLTHTQSLSFSAAAVFLTGFLSPFAGPVGCSCQSHLPYSGCGKGFSVCWPVSLVVSEEFWYPSLEDLLCSSSLLNRAFFLYLFSSTQSCWLPALFHKSIHPLFICPHQSCSHHLLLLSLLAVKAVKKINEKSH